MTVLTDEVFDRCYARILEVFADLGYPHDLIGQWALPPQDLRTLMNILKEQRPRNILEVGTYVGLTTLMMALLSPPETHIHTIDPNLPLEVEMSSMKSALFDFDTSIKSQDLGLLAAHRLGVAEKITFHEGGFSTDNTFASYNTNPAHRITVVGPEVCKQHGPFDFIFIDGLHYDEDVYSDLKLAADYILPAKFIVIHDVLGRWGANVRRAVFRFLEERHDFHFTHGPYYDVFEAIGVLQRRPWDLASYPQPVDREIVFGSIIHEKFFSNLAATVVNFFHPQSVLQLGGNVGLAEQFRALGLPEVATFIPKFQAQPSDSSHVRYFDRLEDIALGKKYDICILFEIMDLIPEESTDYLVQKSVEASDTILFISSPPGELGRYQANNKPITYWVNKFFDKGYLFSDMIRPILEPHVEVLYAEKYKNSTYFLNVYVVKKDNRLVTGSIDKSFFKEVLLDKERRIEDLILQNLYQKCIIQKEITLAIIDRYEVICREYELLIKHYDSINIFNKKVMQNTLKRLKTIFAEFLKLSGKS